jgi:hypothetical protein
VFDRNRLDALVAAATKGGAVSWAATDAVWELFDRERPDCELEMMLAIAHHYNDADGCSRPGITTLAKKCRCTERWVTTLRNRCVQAGDISVISKGGRGPRDLAAIGFAPKYVDWIKLRVNSRTTPLGKRKGELSSAKKGELSSACKGEQPYREKRGRKYESTRKAAAATSGVAMPPPPLQEEDPIKRADFLKHLAEWKAKGRPLGEFPTCAVSETS